MASAASANPDERVYDDMDAVVIEGKLRVPRTGLTQDNSKTGLTCFQVNLSQYYTA